MSEATVIMQETVTISLKKYEDLLHYKKAIEEKKSLILSCGYNGEKVMAINKDQLVDKLIKEIEFMSVSVNDAEKEISELKKELGSLKR